MPARVGPGGTSSPAARGGWRDEAEAQKRWRGRPGDAGLVARYCCRQVNVWRLVGIGRNVSPGEPPCRYHCRRCCGCKAARTGVARDPSAKASRCPPPGRLAGLTALPVMYSRLTAAASCCEVCLELACRTARQVGLKGRRTGEGKVCLQHGRGWRLRRRPATTWPQGLIPLAREVGADAPASQTVR